MIKKLTRFEIANIKVVLARTSSLRKKRDSLIHKITSLEEELDAVSASISKWEEPISDIIGELAPEDVLAHIKDGVLTYGEPEVNTENKQEAEPTSAVNPENEDLPVDTETVMSNESTVSEPTAPTHPAADESENAEIFE